MTEPITTNKNLIAPLTGDLVGAWGTAALKPNFQLIDAMLGGVTTITLSSATTVLLTVPSTSGIATSTVPQSSNALIKFTGVQSGSATIQFTLPGFYIIHNLCTGTASVQLSPAAGTGNSIGAPPGRKVQVFYDGTDMDYVSQPEVGSALDLHAATTYPPWMNACTVKPYLIKDGSTYSTSSYTALAAVLGSTFGGNGITTFGVPDERARARIGLDVNINASYAGRITAAGSGVNGTTMGAVGGSEFMQSHSHTASVIDPGHSHTTPLVWTGQVNQGFLNSTGGSSGEVTATTNVSVTGISVAVNATGAGGSQNMMPVIVSFLPLIKT